MYLYFKNSMERQRNQNTYGPAVLMRLGSCLGTHHSQVSPITCGPSLAWKDFLSLLAPIPPKIWLQGNQQHNCGVGWTWAAWSVCQKALWPGLSLQVQTQASIPWSSDAESHGTHVCSVSPHTCPQASRTSRPM